MENDEAALIQDNEEKIKQLRDEKAHGDEEYKKLLHKAKVQWRATFKVASNFFERGTNVC